MKRSPLLSYVLTFRLFSFPLAVLDFICWPVYTKPDLTRKRNLLDKFLSLSVIGLVYTGPRTKYSTTGGIRKIDAAKICEAMGVEFCRCFPFFVCWNGNAAESTCCRGRFSPCEAGTPAVFIVGRLPAGESEPSGGAQRFHCPTTTRASTEPKSEQKTPKKY